jgi:hypothetical protein
VATILRENLVDMPPYLPYPLVHLAQKITRWTSGWTSNQGFLARKLRSSDATPSGALPVSKSFPEAKMAEAARNLHSDLDHDYYVGFEAGLHGLDFNPTSIEYIRGYREGKRLSESPNYNGGSQPQRSGVSVQK